MGFRVVVTAAVVFGLGACTGGNETPEKAASGGDVTFTEPSDQLKPGQRATAAAPDGTDGAVEVVVETIEAASPSDLRLVAGVPVGGSAYYVDVTFANVGTTPVDVTNSELYMRDDTGVLHRAAKVAGRWQQCRGAIRPRQIEPGEEATGCLIFVVPASTEAVSVDFHSRSAAEANAWPVRDQS